MVMIGVTMEVTKRLYREFEISNEKYDQFIEGMLGLSDAIGFDTYINFINDVENDSDYDTDFAVTDEDGVTIIDWD